jgi:GntR family transcriptional regulator
MPQYDLYEQRASMDQETPVTLIERASAVPYYEQLHDVLLERIRSGEVAPGERLPGESELHRDFSLSRATVRQALDLLEAHGWATKVPRRGYFASVPERDQGWKIEGERGFLDSEIGHGNTRVTTDVLRAERQPLPDHAARALGASAGSTGFLLDRVRMVDGNVVLFSTNFTPPTVAPVVEQAAGVLDGTSSLTLALRDAGYVPAGSRRVIHALPAPQHIADHLSVPAGSPLLRVRSTTWDSSQAPYDYYETWLRSDRVPLELNTISQPR